MPRMIALLRGINVGGHRVKMDRLRELLTAMGLRDVQTILASGNVLFEPSGGEPEIVGPAIEACLLEGLGYEVPVLLRSHEEMQRVADRIQALPPAPSVYVAFLPEPADAELRARLTALCSDMDDFVFGDREIFWCIQGKISESPLFGRDFDRATRGHVLTTRNRNTVEKLAARSRD